MLKNRIKGGFEHTSLLRSNSTPAGASVPLLQRKVILLSYKYLSCCSMSSLQFSATTIIGTVACTYRPGAYADRGHIAIPNIARYARPFYFKCRTNTLFLNLLDGEKFPSHSTRLILFFLDVWINHPNFLFFTDVESHNIPIHPVWSVCFRCRNHSP